MTNTGDVLLRRKNVESRTLLSRTTIYDRMAAGTFPQPIQLGLRAVAWRASDVEAWLASRPAGVRKPVRVGRKGSNAVAR